MPSPRLWRVDTPFVMIILLLLSNLGFCTGLLATGSVTILIILHQVCVGNYDCKSLHYNKTMYYVHVVGFIQHQWTRVCISDYIRHQWTQVCISDYTRHQWTQVCISDDICHQWTQVCISDDICHQWTQVCISDDIRHQWTQVCISDDIRHQWTQVCIY